MLTFFDRLVEVNFTSAAVRMLLAVLCGGIIGMERTYKRRAAGFRTKQRLYERWKGSSRK